MSLYLLPSCAADLFAEGEEATAKPKKTKTGGKKKSKKPSEPKDYSMFDPDAPSIFA